MNYVYGETIRSGSEKYCKVIAEALKDRGHEVFVITTKPYKNLESLKVSATIIDGIKVYSIWPLLLNMPIYSKKIFNFGRVFTFLFGFFNPYIYYTVKKILKKESPDVIQTNDVIYLSLSVFRAAKLLNTPVVHTLHYYSLIHPLGSLLNLRGEVITRPSILDKIYAKLNEFIIGDSVKIVASVSKFCLNKHLEYGVFSDKKCVVIPNLFSFTIKEKLDGSNGIIKKYFDILYVGALATTKGMPTLIKAFKKIQNTNARLHIVGGGELKIETKSLMELGRNDNRITFYGRIQNDKIKEFYEMTDVTVVPSELYETFGRVIIESFIDGKPVIGSKIGAIPELIQEGYNGFLFEPRNAEQLKEILEYVILNQDKLKKMRENCINTAKKYSVENNIYKLEEIYKEAIKLKQEK